MSIWNPWHGCTKISPGCLHCYVYRRDDSVGRDASTIFKTNDFDLPVQKAKSGEYKLSGTDGTVFTCMTSDFFVEEADAWRPEAWAYIRERQDLNFIIITKRIDRFSIGLPADWGEGYPNVTIASTCENQDRADFRLPLLINAPIRHRAVVAEPFLEPLEIESYLRSGQIDEVVCGGESGEEARPLYYEWILSLRDQCIKTGTRFSFRQTGSLFVMNGHAYHIERKFQLAQAQKANINFIPVYIPKDFMNPPLPPEAEPIHATKAAISPESTDPNRNSTSPATAEIVDSGIHISGINYPIEEIDEEPDLTASSDENQDAPSDEAGHENHSAREEEQIRSLFEHLQQSRFRSQFHLHKEERDYIAKIGLSKIESHARDFIRTKLAPKEPFHDGKQTPMHGHPVFLAQHATGCCCRECLRKWHHISPGRPLTEEEQDYIVHVIMTWIHKELAKQ